MEFRPGRLIQNANQSKRERNQCSQRFSGVVPSRRLDNVENYHLSTYHDMYYLSVFENIPFDCFSFILYPLNTWWVWMITKRVVYETSSIVRCVLFDSTLNKTILARNGATSRMSGQSEEDSTLPKSRFGT